VAGEGTDYTIDLSGLKGADAVTAAADGVQRLTATLEAAEASTTAAADAVKAGEAAYKAAENAANKAALAVEKLGIAAQGASGAKLEGLLASQAQAAAKAKEATAAMNAEAVSLDKLKAAAARAAGAEKKLGNDLAAAKKASGTGDVGAAAGALGKLGGPLGSLGQKAFDAADAFKKMGASLGSAGPYAAIAVAIVAIVAAVAAVAAAAIAATVAVGAWAVSLADAARTQSLLAAGVAKSVKGGQVLEGVIDGISNQVPLTADELMGLSKPLVEAGLQGAKLYDALEAAAVKAATTKFGPEFLKQMNSLPNLTARLQKSFSRIFSGLKIDALLEALGSMVALFDKGTASSKAIATVFESLFQPLLDGVTAFVPKMISAFIQFEILVLKAMIAIKPFGSKIVLLAEAFGILAIVTGVILGAALLLLLSPLILIATGFTIIIAAVLYFMDELNAAGMAIYNFQASIVNGIGSALTFMKSKFDEVVAFLSGISLGGIGTAMIDGLVGGITSAGPKVLSAITGLATGAITAAKKALGIASPSTIFAEIGAHTAEGMEEGVDGGASAVQGALEGMTTPPTASGKAGGPGSSSGTTVYQVTIQGGDAQSNVDAFRAFLEGLGAQAGVAEVPSAT
jgi:hypothetical protein